jgi:lysyl endopeptidase
MKIVTYSAYAALLVSGLLTQQVLADADTPLSFQTQQQLSASKRLSLPALNNKSLLSRDNQKSRASNENAAYIRYAEPRAVSFSPQNDNWDLVIPEDATAEPMYVWRGIVESRGALSLNLGFGRYQMPAGGSLHIYKPDRSEIIRPFTAADNEEHGQLWTPIVSGDQLVVEVNIPASQINQLQLELTSINHGYVGQNIQSIYQVALKSASCNVDVACPAGDAWRDQARAVAAYGTGDGLFCTGAAINNTANNGKPYFLTAEHCEITASNAPSMVVYWNYQNSTCRSPGSAASGGNGDGRLNQFNSGAIWRAGYKPTDMTLVELDDPIKPEYNVYLAGWDASSNLPRSAAGIHHPNTDEKRISLDNDPLFPDSGTHLSVGAWEVGTTEPGSSGSPLFNQDKRIVGQLTGGGASCSNRDEGDSYGWLHISWEGGGSANSRLRNWLDPQGTGQLTLDGRNANAQATPTPTPTPTPPPTPTPNNALQKGVAKTNLSASKGQQLMFTLSVPAGATNLSINMTGTNGDADLYVKFGSPASTASNDCAPYLEGSNETCQFANPQAGTYHILMDAFTAFTGAGLVANYDLPGAGGNGQNLNLSIAQGKWFRHSIQVPANTRTLTVTTSGGRGDADLYVRRGTAPTTSTATCKSESDSNTETCTIQNPAAGTWHIGIFGYNAVSGLKETWSFK